MVVKFLALALALMTQASTPAPAVVFVCEHGAQERDRHSVFQQARFDSINVTDGREQ